MGCVNSKEEDIKNVLYIFKQTIKFLSDGVKPLTGFNFIEHTVKQLSKVIAEFSDEERKALQCIIKANKTIAIAVNDAKNLISDVKSLCNTLATVLNSQDGSYNKKIRLAILLFNESFGSLLAKLYNAIDGLNKVTPELEAIALKITHLMTWCLGKKQELENVKKICVAKERRFAYGGAAGTTVAVGGTVAAVCLWSPIGLLAGIVAAGVAASSTAAVSFSVAVAVAEGATIPQLQKMFDEGIKGMQESVNKFQEMSNKSKERTRRLNETLKQLTEIASFAHQSKANASITHEFDVNDVMFNKLKKDIRELEELSETFLNSRSLCCRSRTCF